MNLEERSKECHHGLRVDAGRINQIQDMFQAFFSNKILNKKLFYFVRSSD